jgi:magnesium-transporting ATPase (P-type)
VEGTGYAPEGSVDLDGQKATLDGHGSLQALVEVMAVCNDAELRQVDNLWSVLGEPTEGALRTLAHKVDFDESPYERLAVVPFESDNKFMATLNRLPSGGVRILLKGAPDRLLDRSAHQLEEDGSRPWARKGCAYSPRPAARRKTGRAPWPWRTCRRTWSSSAWWASSIRPGPRRSRRSAAVGRPASGW